MQKVKRELLGFIVCSSYDGTPLKMEDGILWVGSRVDVFPTWRDVSNAIRRTDAYGRRNGYTDKRWASGHFTVKVYRLPEAELKRDYRAYAEKKRLRPSQIKEIKQFRTQGVTLKEIGKRFGITESGVSRVLSRNA